MRHLKKAKYPCKTIQTSRQVNIVEYVTDLVDLQTRYDLL